MHEGLTRLVPSLITYSPGFITQAKSFKASFNWPVPSHILRSLHAKLEFSTVQAKFKHRKVKNILTFKMLMLQILECYRHITRGKMLCTLYFRLKKYL